MAKENFYNGVLNKIINLMDKKKYREALDLINQELSMPYIPPKFESQFKELRIEASVNLTSDNLINEVSLKEVEEAFFRDGSLNSIIGIIHKLKKLNISHFLEPIKKYLIDKSGDDIAKSIIIFALKESNIAGIFKIIKNNQEMEFEPTKIIETNQQKSFLIGKEIIDNAFKKEINKLNMAEQTYFTTLFAIAPFKIEQNFAKKAALKAIDNVNKAFK